MSLSRAFALLGAAFIVALCTGTWLIGWRSLWASPDQRGRYLFERQRWVEAAAAFSDPLWRGVAQMRAGDFKAAEASFASVDTATGAYDQGNALVMLGKYDEAIKRYGHALDLKPDWPEAQQNLRVVERRAQLLQAPGADSGDQQEGADEIVYDKNAKNRGGQETQTTGAEAMGDEAVRALWLKRVQTKPADFLRARFAYQLEAQTSVQSRKPVP